jgi:hypothetical protein
VNFPEKFVEAKKRGAASFFASPHFSNPSRLLNSYCGPCQDRPRTGDVGIRTDLDLMIEMVIESLKKEPIDLKWSRTETDLPDIAADHSSDVH